MATGAMFVAFLAAAWLYESLFSGSEGFGWWLVRALAFVLRSFAAALRRCSREGDTVARYGGEEFVVLLPEASMSAAAGFHERLKADLESASERGDLPAHTASGGRGRFIAHRRGARGREAR